MYRIVPPITTGQYGPDVQNLQDTLLLLIEKGDITISGNFPLGDLNNERIQSFFGDVTTDVVALFKTQNSLSSPPIELVNHDVADALNAVMGQYPDSLDPDPDLITISGNVTHISGNLFSTSYTVKIEQVFFDSTVEVSTTTIDAGGFYTTNVSAPTLTPVENNFSFQIIVVVDVSEEYKSKIVQVPDVQRQVVIDIVIDNEITVASEYTTIKTKVEALIGSTEIQDITVDVDDSQAEFLAKNLNENIRDIRALIYAHKLSIQLDDLEPELFYGLLRNNLPFIAEQLLFQNKLTFTNALTYSSNTNIISPYTEGEIETFVDALKLTIITAWNTSNSSDLQKTLTFRIYNTVLDDTELTNEFLSVFFNFENLNLDTDFWEYLEDEFTDFDTHIKSLKTVTVIAVIIGNNPALVGSLLGILGGDTFSTDQTLDIVSGDPQPELLAGLTNQNWIDIITDAKSSNATNFIFPDYVIGEDDEEKIEFYAERLYTNFTSIYPIYNIKAKIADDEESPFPTVKENIGTFLENNPGIDLRAISMVAIKATEDNPYDLTDVEDLEDFIEELAIIQRLSAITSRYEVMAGLANDGIVSAFHITEIDKSEFGDTYEELFGTKEAAIEAADAADSITTHVIGKAYATYSEMDFKILPWDHEDERYDPVPPGSSFETPPLVDPYADWRVLFGSLDGCSCCHCESVFSPSAYLVDTLNFLRKSNNSSWTTLTADRRPDISNIELTCDNSNIALPYIDLVNELLEDLVSDNSALGGVYARQTRAAAEYQRASPEYMNTNGYQYSSTVFIDTPYSKLLEAQYPWTLPYNVFKRQIDTHLSIPGIKGHELVQRFSSMDFINSLDTTQYCTNYLNISNELRTTIITASALSSGTNYKDLQVHYGFTVNYNPASAFRSSLPNPQLRGYYLTLLETTWTASLTDRVDLFLQQTHLSYRELLELLDCYYINPVHNPEEEDPELIVRKFAILNNSSTTDITTCRLDQLRIEPANSADIPSFLDRLHRFVRFSRALGWHFYDLDIALRAVGSNTINETSFKKIAQLKHLSDTLNIKVADCCILFQDIEGLPYRDYMHEDENCELIEIPDQYTRIFRSTAMVNSNLESPFPPKPISSIFLPDFPTVKLDVFANYISGIVQLKPNELQIILDEVYSVYSSYVDLVDSEITINISILSYIHRQNILIKSLKLSVKEWMFYKKWITDSAYFGNTSGDAPNNTASNPISTLGIGSPYSAIPFDTVRFINCLKLFKNAGFSYNDLEYLLLDKPLDAVSDLKLNAAIAEVLGVLRTDLAKKWYPDYDPDGDNASKDLLAILITLIDEADAQNLMSIVDRELDTVVEYTTEEYDFIHDKLAFLLTNGAEILADTGSVDYESDINLRYAYVYAEIKKYIINTILKPLILSDLAKYLKIEEQSIQVLLNDVINIEGSSGFDLLLNPEFALSTETIERWDTFDDQFTIALILQKSSLLIARFGLGTLDVQNFWSKTITGTDDPVVPGILKITDLPIRPTVDTIFIPGTNSNATLRLFRNLNQWMNVRAFLGADINILFKAIENENNVVENMASVFRMSMADLDALIILPPYNGSTDEGILDIDDTMYQTPISYLRIIDCLEMQHLMPASMYTLYKVSSATRTADEQSNAAEVIHLVKAPYTDKQWLEIVEPISDLLRVERRDVLIDYLLAYPYYPYRFSWLTSLDIYETLLIDVEMMPVMQTTRILQANNTVQLWMDRVLLQLEAHKLTNDKAREWTSWRKIYRVWEANRKVFLYPENWIEPELRDDKTPLFIELEKFLKQNEVTKENVEEAYKTYLERLDQISNLDIIGIYRETAQDYKESLPEINKDIVHAFGRTKEHPHLFFYRKREMSMWTAWEKMDIQIEGDHFIPTMWRGRLRLYWLVFTKDQEQVPVSSVQTEGSLNMPAGVRWKIQIAWTEYKDKRWTAKQMSKDAVFSKFIYEEKPISFEHIQLYSSGYMKGYMNRLWNEEGDLEKIKRESIIFIADKDNDGCPTFSIIERDYRVTPNRLYNETTKFFSKYGIVTPGAEELTTPNSKFVYGRLRSWLDSDYQWVTDTEDRYWTHIGQFIVKYNGVSVIKAPDTGHVDQSIYIDYAGTKPLDKYDLQSAKGGYWPCNTDYFYWHPHHLGYSHFPDKNIKLLDGSLNYPAHYFGLESLKALPFTPSFTHTDTLTWVVRNRHKSRYLVFPRKIPNSFSGGDHIQIPYFFYKDNKNTFFVEKVSLFHVLTPMIASGVMVDYSLMESAAKIDAKTATGISLDAGIGSAEYDIVHPEPEFREYPVPGGGLEDVVAEMKSGKYVAAYRFHNFVHERVDEFLDQLHSKGLDGLLDRNFINGITDSMNFSTVYNPTTNVHGGHYLPHNKVDFSADGAYSAYNWELFFHIPMLIANKLSQNQQFDQARLWYHYVFNPTNSLVDTTDKFARRFWNFQPFYDKASSVESFDSVMKSPTLEADVDRWSKNPFKPHLIARTRITAYMKNAVMKYLDNLIAWGDNLFSSDSREAISEATLLYVLALQILGRRPEIIPARAKPEVQTYATIKDKLNAFGNAMVASENVLLSSGSRRHLKKVIVGEWVDGVWGPPIYYEYLKDVEFNLKGSMYYFCTPFNEKLLQYWDILADRLFKIRNSQSIDGVTRDLALFAPPIDPAILVKAAAAGVSLAGILGDMNAPLPSYRFNVMSQKASELANEVKSLGGQLLAALEKKDAEQISLLRSSQEIKVLEAVTDLKEKQISESKTQWEVLGVQLKSAVQRQTHYKQLIENGLIGPEQSQLDSLKKGIPLQIAQGVVQGIGAGLGAIPQAHSTLPGVSFGGIHLASVMNAAAAVIGIEAGVNNTRGTMAGINGGYERRKQDWNLQLKLANVEVEQINKQLIAAEIRFAMSEVELRNHKLQMTNAQEMEVAMREKYTNEELYDWMIGQISFTYFQGYKLAYETAKKAERCFRYELNLDTSDYIQYGYWDSLKKGLLAGENLAYDLKRMEVAYLDMNKRQLELTKHVSLAALDSEALINLITNKECQFDIPEWLFDMDYPGQHMRRIKSVSLSIPCVAGPYTTISAKLSLKSSKYRKNGFLLGGEYTESTSGDSRFTYMFGNIQSIATSNAQNDSGMFEMNFRDERYLPFEGCGAISSWSLELPATFAQFDYSTISDVIVHIKYTALDGGATKVKAKEYVDEAIKMALDGTDKDGIYRLMNLKQEFSNEWHQYLNGSVSELNLTNIRSRLPYLVQDTTLELVNVALFVNKLSGSPSTIDFKNDSESIDESLAKANVNEDWEKYIASDIGEPIDAEDWHISGLTPADITHAWLIIQYKKTTP